MNNVIFLVKNGIGFGHIRRALLVAEALRGRGQLRPLLISQASSMAMYQRTRVQVVNFPLLHRVPSAIAEDWYTQVLDRLLERLDPAIVVEDTYPDQRYGTLPSIRDRPRLLVMRRLDGLSFDQIRQRGGFAAYDEVLIAQDEGRFQLEGHSGESLAAVAYSGRFRFVGDIFQAPTQREVAGVKAEYAPDGAPLVVVNGGAGGDQMPDGYGDRLFSACQAVAQRLAATGSNARFVFVTGPYYAGRPPTGGSNVLVRRFEPRLPALLGAARVAAIKPGYNALMEALSGGAHLILIPDASFMEGSDEYAARVAAEYGGAVADPEAAVLEPLIRDALDRPPRTIRLAPASEALSRIVEAIHMHAEAAPQIEVSAKRLLLLILPPRGQDSAVVRHCLPTDLRSAVVVDERHEPRSAAVTPLSTVIADPMIRATAVLVDREPPRTAPQELADRGVRLLLQQDFSEAVPRWLRLQPTIPALMQFTAPSLRAVAGRPGAFARSIRRLLDADDAACLVLDPSQLSEAELGTYLEQIGGWLADQPVRLVGPTEYAAIGAIRLLEPA